MNRVEFELGDTVLVNPYAKAISADAYSDRLAGKIGVIYDITDMRALRLPRGYGRGNPAILYWILCADGDHSKSGLWESELKNLSKATKFSRACYGTP